MASWFNLTWRLLALRLLTAVVVYSLAAPLALYFLLTLLFRLVRSPFSGFWRLVPRHSPPAVLQDPKLGEHAFVTLDKGIKLHYVHAGDPSRPLLLFLHGFPGFWFSWKHQLPEFAKDYWVVALDMRGYGDSDKPSGSSSYRADILVDDIKELLDAFERPRATLVGHGWGAAVAWMFLERYPERVDKLVSMGAPHPYVFQRAVILNRKQLFRSWYLFLFQVPVLPELVLRCDDLACLVAALRKHATLPDEDAEAFKYTFGQPGALTAPLNYYRAAGWGLPRRRRRPRSSPTSTTTTTTTSPSSPEEQDASPAEALTSTTLHQDHKQDDEEEQQEEEAAKCADSTTASSPAVLVLLGGRDAYVEHSTAFRTRKSFPNVSVVIVRGANHFVQLHYPEAVNIAVRKFLEK